MTQPRTGKKRRPVETVRQEINQPSKAELEHEFLKREGATCMHTLRHWLKALVIDKFHENE
jgi:hypothetical protein